MSRPKFTPGPWKRVHSHPDAEHRASVAYIESKDRARPLEIATLYMCDSDPEMSANADLIAVAPDLYAALREAHDFINCWHATTDTPEGRKATALMNKMRTVIAKAEGRS